MAIVFAKLGFEAELIPRIEHIFAHRGVQYVLFCRAWRAPTAPTLAAELPFLDHQLDMGDIGNVFTWRLGPKEQSPPFEV